MYPVLRSQLPSERRSSGDYQVRFARTRADLRAIQRLRYEVFRVEEGLGSASWDVERLDREALDDTSHHLLVEKNGEAVGTYRLRTTEHAAIGDGYYSRHDFDLTSLPDRVLDRGVELSRACVHPSHRNGRVLLSLWKGLARYIDANELRHVFGCCSVPTMDGPSGWALHRRLLALEHAHPDFNVAVRVDRRCERRESIAAPLPPLFESYLRIGARVCSGPALDRDFRVISFFVVLDLEAMRPSTRATLFRGSEALRPLR